jgi:predicted Zn-dependent peptidase
MVTVLHRAVRIAVALLALTWVAAGSQPARAQAPAPADSSLESQVKEFRLPNGLLCLVVERHFSPIFSFVIQVDAGAVDEPVGKTGVAHMMEHMAFKGTPQVGTKDARAEASALAKVDQAWGDIIEQKELALFHRADSTRTAAAWDRFRAAQTEAEGLSDGEAFSKAMEENGAQDLNASTGADQTTYYCSLPSNKLELWALLEGSQMTWPVFRDFYKERDVVIEERRMRTESSPRSRLWEETMQAAFTAHPYRNGIIGYRSDLESFSRGDAETFFRQHYDAANMCLVLVGDVKLEDVKKMVGEYFSEMPPGPKSEPVLTVEPAPKAERFVRVREEAQPLCYAAYYGGPAFTDPEYLAVEALTDILSSGRSSRLYSRLVKEERLATGIFCSSGLPGDKYRNLVFLSATPAPGVSPDSLADAVQRELEAVATHPITDSELQGYRSRAKSQFIRGLHSNRGLASQLAYYQIRTGDWRNLFRWLDQIERLRPEEVTAQAARIFTRERRTLGILEAPPGPRPKGGRS